MKYIGFIVWLLFSSLLLLNSQSFNGPTTGLCLSIQEICKCKKIEFRVFQREKKVSIFFYFYLVNRVLSNLYITIDIVAKHSKRNLSKQIGP